MPSSSWADIRPALADDGHPTIRPSAHPPRRTYPGNLCDRGHGSL
eukprot:CAMPEP_0182611056 /NCGR_PEP_ID=MMETSP1330-20130603/12032_1 /TAXON_ID=464278 /ORGANISM="Picochlorum sp., Strain RCC944" /LENGTH=44 /DNA_ID= /DNA_START= /DNA_END= /DNA_ORIENTATION=